MIETLARISIRLPLATVGIWLMVLGAAAILSLNLLDSATTTELHAGGGFESQRADRLLEQLRGPKRITEIVIVQSDTHRVSDDAFREKTEAIYDAILALGSGVVAEGRNYYQEGDPSLVSADLRTTIMPLVLSGSASEAEANVRHVLELVEDANGSDGFRVLIGGSASIALEGNERNERDNRRGERIGVPVALFILLVFFGAVVAALVPLGLALVAIVVAIGIVAIVGQVHQMLFFVQAIITMIGLAVGIDYSLLIVARFREEMARGLKRRQAVMRTVATAGRTVLYSGITVVIALCGILLVPADFFRSLGFGAILVVIVALLATLTLLPAVLLLLGPRVDLLPVPFIGRAGSQNSRSSRGGVWETMTRAVTRFPLVGILGVGGPMVVLAAFYFQINTGVNGVEAYPEGSQTRAAFRVLEEEFSFGLVSPAEIAVSGDVNNPQVRQAVEDFREALVNDPMFPSPPSQPAVSPAGDLALMTVVIPGESNGEAALDAVAALRGRHVPSAFDGVPAEVGVGGETALIADLLGVIDTFTPIVFAFILGCSFIMLLLVFRSVVIPLKAIGMNLLSVGASYGLLVIVFQRGLGADLLGFQRIDVIEAWLPLFLFSILFGLSMDYHVFLLSRIRERYDQSGDNTESVVYGLRSTAGLITGAALVMVAVFGGFASGDAIITQQVGFGLAVAVLLDATLVRSVLVPASMSVLGKANWYLPPFLRWLPDLRVRPAE